MEKKSQIISINRTNSIDQKLLKNHFILEKMLGTSLVKDINIRNYFGIHPITYAIGRAGGQMGRWQLHNIT